ANYTGFSDLRLNNNLLAGTLEPAWAPLIWSSEAVRMGVQASPNGGWVGSFPSTWYSYTLNGSYVGSRLKELYISTATCTCGGPPPFPRGSWMYNKQAAKLLTVGTSGSFNDTSCSSSVCVLPPSPLPS
ncbi:hypothetical protein VaNZ11_002186, partial [Volvox africanus]